MYSKNYKYIPLRLQTISEVCIYLLLLSDGSNMSINNFQKS